VMPEFKDAEEARLRRKNEELAPYIEAAMARKVRAAEMRDEEIPTFESYGYNIAEVDVAKLPEAQQRRMEQFQKMREVVERYNERDAAAPTH